MPLDSVLTAKKQQKTPSWKAEGIHQGASTFSFFAITVTTSGKIEKNIVFETVDSVGCKYELPRPC